jgi:hypothetical protein
MAVNVRYGTHVARRPAMVSSTTALVMGVMSTDVAA